MTSGEGSGEVHASPCGHAPHKHHHSSPITPHAGLTGPTPRTGKRAPAHARTRPAHAASVHIPHAALGLVGRVAPLCQCPLLILSPFRRLYRFRRSRESRSIQICHSPGPRAHDRRSAVRQPSDRAPQSCHLFHVRLPPLHGERRRRVRVAHHLRKRPLVVGSLRSGSSAAQARTERRRPDTRFHPTMSPSRPITAKGGSLGTRYHWQRRHRPRRRGRCAKSHGLRALLQRVRTTARLGGTAWPALRHPPPITL